MPQSTNRTAVDSPCVRNCCLDGEDICMGCGRHLQEILQWQSASDPERAAILMRAATRRAQARFAPNKQ